MNGITFLYAVKPNGYTKTFHVAAANQDDAVGKLYAYLSELQADGHEWRDTAKYDVLYIDAVIL
jgi:hypothetical protein